MRSDPLPRRSQGDSIQPILLVEEPVGILGVSPWPLAPSAMQIDSNPFRHISPQVVARLGAVPVIEVLHPAPHLLVEVSDDRCRWAGKVLARGPFLMAWRMRASAFFDGRTIGKARPVRGLRRI